MPSKRIAYLLQQYLDKLITEDELSELKKLLEEEAAGEEVRQALEGLVVPPADAAPYREEAWEPLFQKILDRAGAVGGDRTEVVEMQPRRRRFILRPMGWAAAAAILILLAGGLWFGRKDSDSPKVVSLAHDAAPGGDKAVLTLGDGSTVRLDEVQEGVVGRQGRTQLIKSKDAQLRYQAAGGEESIQYNTLATPRGGQYKLVLPDGTKVWLNAATSIRYPTVFTGDHREVDLKGEAYFEVAANAAMPFRVRVLKGEENPQTRPVAGPMLVEVLGTHFNIMGYADEPVIRTTLLEGAVRVRKDDAAVLVRPGEQARLNVDGSLVVVKADVEEAVAWKNGLFKFEEADIRQVMRQLSRWYDLEVVYTHGVPGDRFQGEMYRNVNVSGVLKILEASGVRFTVEGKKLLVQ